MAMAKKSLELLFDHLHHNEHKHIPEVIQDAVEEYTVLKNELDRDERKKVNFIKSMIDYCNAEQWFLARKQLEPAEEEYYRYFFRKLAPSAMINRSPITLYSDMPTDKDSRRMGDRPDSRQSRPRPSSVTNASQKVATQMPSSERNIQTARRTVRITDLSDLNTIQKISVKFEELYKNEWAAALDELQQLKIGDKSAVTCLFRTVLDAYRVCATEADTQIAKLEDAALNILLDGSHVHSDVLKGHRSYLLDYRRDIADVCVDRLQETFRRRYLPEIIRSIGVYQNIRTHGSMLTFANQCVSICWAMAILDPQVYVVDDRDGHGLFSAELYTAYTKFGQSVEFYVWPPLRTRKDGGQILSKGVAQAR